MADLIIIWQKQIKRNLKKNSIVWFLFFKWTLNTIVFCLPKISPDHSLRVKGLNWNLSTVTKKLLHQTSSLFWFVIYDFLYIISLRYSAPTGNIFWFEINWIQNKQKFCPTSCVTNHFENTSICKLKEKIKKS